MTCDVYVLGVDCGTVFVYPSQVHPHPDVCVPSAGGHVHKRGYVNPYEKMEPNRDEEEALLLALLLPYP